MNLYGVLTEPVSDPEALFWVICSPENLKSPLKKRGGQEEEEVNDDEIENKCIIIVI